MSHTPVNVGVIGCGNISGIYLEAGKKFDILNIVACADLDLDRAKAQATKYGVPWSGSVTDLLADPSIELVVNLTVPQAHASIALAALEAGKSVYNEKPLTIERAEAKQLLDLAQARGLRVGCAPDTFLGGGLQTCRKLIDEGAIGRPVGATAFMISRGPERWHPNPDFFYQRGAGPMFDMGPYYLTALTTLLGPVQRVTGSAQISFPERPIYSQPHAGEVIQVNTPTFISGVFDFTAGVVGTILTTFDVWAAELPRIEIYGADGTLSLPDPNTFGGPVRLRRGGEQEWQDIPLTHGYIENSRGLGLADLAYGLRNGRAHRASGELAYHVLDLMHAFHDASREGRHIIVESTMARPAALPSQWPDDPENA
jgi:predicted dehydrogenase